MVEALSPEEQIASLRLEVTQYRAAIAELTTERDVSRSELAEAAVFKARLTTALLEIEHMKMQLAALRRQRYGQSSEKLDREIAQLEMRLMLQTMLSELQPSVPGGRWRRGEWVRRRAITLVPAAGARVSWSRRVVEG